MNALTGLAVIGSGAGGALGPALCALSAALPVCVPPRAALEVIWLVAPCELLPPPICPPPKQEKKILPPSSMSCLVRAFSFSQLQSSSCCQPASGGPQCSSTAEQRAEPPPPQPPLVHLTFCLEGWDCVEDHPCPCHFFSSLRSWSFTFVSEVTFSTCFSSLLLPLLLLSPSVSFFFTNSLW